MMNKKTKIKVIIDVLMTVALLFLMPYEMIGEALHEWIGAGIFLLFVIHHILNRKWIGNIPKGRYTPLRIVQTVLVVLILAGMLGSMISGIILSRHVFAFFKISGGTAIARVMHMTCAYWGFVLMSLHMGLHWSMMMGMARKAFPGSSSFGKWMVRIAGFAIAGYGLYAFIKREIGSYMLMQIHFVFFDYEEPVIFFLLDYMAAMALFVFTGHYLCEVIKKKGIRKNEV